jgi:hypothetical protein
MSVDPIGASAALAPEPPDPDRVLLGTGGWLFLRNDINGALEQQLGERGHSASTHERWSEELQRRVAWSEENGWQYVALFAPDKESVYRDKLPPETAARLIPHEQRPVPSLRSHLAALGDVSTIYPLERLVRARASLETYYRSDTHWSTWGAFVAYRALAEQLRHDGASLDLHHEGRLAFRLAARYGDLGGKLDPPRESRFLTGELEPRLAEIVYDNRVRNNGRVLLFKREDPAARSLARCLVFGDSFGLSLSGFLKESFRETVVVHTSRGIDYALAEAISPDVLITVTVERFAIDPPDSEVSVRDILAHKVSAEQCDESLGTFPTSGAALVGDDLLGRVRARP